jgi:hypothetical protein
MLTKYSVEFRISFRRHQITHHYRTDDPVALEEFIVELLEKGYRLESILHDGIPYHNMKPTRYSKPLPPSWRPNTCGSPWESTKQKRGIGSVFRRESAEGEFLKSGK